MAEKRQDLREGSGAWARLQGISPHLEHGGRPFPCRHHVLGHQHLHEAVRVQDYTEHPNCTGGYGGHIDGVHGDVEADATLKRHVFRFDIHIDPVIDGDCCSASTVDRQRNEMKSITNNSTWAKVQGNWDEWQILEWKFKLPIGLQPTGNFFHIHQLKAQDGPNNGAPTITITPEPAVRARTKGFRSFTPSMAGLPTRARSSTTCRSPNSRANGSRSVRRCITRFEGHYSVKITRIRDGKVLIDFTDPNIDMWRIGSSYIRSKFGLYRSLAGGRLDQDPVGQSPLLRTNRCGSRTSGCTRRIPTRRRACRTSEGARRAFYSGRSGAAQGFNGKPVRAASQCARSTTSPESCTCE